MTKRYTILQKKLQELDSQLVNICSLPVAPLMTHQLLAEDFEQRLVFLKNLLSTEIASHPTKPHHLNHMSHRLDYIESTFREWDSTGPTALHNVDSASTCSCTESCVNDDGEVLSPDDGDDDDDDAGSPANSEGLLEDKALVEYSRSGLVEDKAVAVVLESEKDVRKEQAGKILVGGGVLCGAVASGMVLGMALMSLGMVMFSGGFTYGVDGNFLAPT